MAQTLQTSSAPGDARITGAIPAGAASAGLLDGILDGLWHGLTSMRFAIALTLIAAALSFVGALVMQAPAGVLADANAKAAWIAQVRPKYGAFTDVFDALQVFNIFNSLWFRLVGGLLVASITACTAHRTPAVWRTATKPTVDVGEAFFEHAPQHEAMVVHRSADEALAAVRTVLGKRRFRTLVHNDGTMHLYADRNRWGPFGSLVGHLAFVVILAGAMIGGALGFQNPDFTIAEGSTLTVPSATGLSIRLDAFRDSYDPATGMPLDYASQVVLFEDGTEVARHTIRVNDPLRYDGISFFQSFFGPAVILSATADGGSPLFSGGVPLAWSADDSDRAIGTLDLPGTGKVAWVAGTSGGNDTVVRPGQLLVEIYQADGAGTLVERKTIDQGVATTVGGVTFTFQREEKFTGLAISRDPGAPLIWLGSLLLFGGFVLVLMFPHRRLWGRIAPRPDGGATLLVGSIGRKDTTAGIEFTELVNDLRAVLHAPART
ncbi:MAG TPA: cytochrome c biogenesis protein ResB [Candidatus Limnocylindrales bacterium]|nr:cytochrome c biogenesis protein ResB [Candidatus Limnocylindrales bacterium]